MSMGENQNGWNTNDAPRTYGEDSKLYESGQNPYAQPNGGSQPNYGAGQNPYGQAYGSGQPNYGAGQNPYTQPNYGGQSYGYGGQSYGYGQNGYGYNPNGVWQGNLNPQLQHMPVTDVFCYILLGIFLVSIVINFVVQGQIYGEMDSYYSLTNGSYLTSLAGSSLYQALSVLSNLLFVVMVVFIVLDIVKVHKANYKITGLILFAIFLKPGYYLWRAHILGRKKTFPIIYTVIYGGLMIAYYVYTFYCAFLMAFQLSQDLIY